MPHDECPMAIALKEQRAICGAEAVAERPDGRCIPFLAYPTRYGVNQVRQLVNTVVGSTDRREHRDLGSI
jgi:hypothetical protein